MSEQTLSVVIPNFNHADCLAAAVESCYLHGRPADEVVVVDDGSTDDSMHVLERLAREYPSLRIIRHERNRGAASALNTGVHAARCQWVLLRAADDLFPGGSIDAFRRIAEQFPESGLITGDVVYFQRDPSRGVREHMGRSRIPVAITAQSFVERFGNNLIHGAASFCRKRWITEAGGLDEALRWHCDWHLFTRIGLNRGFVYAPEVFGCMRLNAESYNAKGTSIENLQSAVLERLIEKLEASSEELSRILASGSLDFFGEPLLCIFRKQGKAQSDVWGTLFREQPDAVRQARLETGLGAVMNGFLSRNRELLRAHAGRVAIFGAGGHTRWLMECWRERGIPAAVMILDSGGGEVSGELMGVPVCRLEAVSKLAGALVVLSSKSYEPALASLMEQRAPGVRYLRIWGADDR